MDKPKHVRRVTVTTERTFIFKSRSSARIGWCADCGAEVAMMSVEGAARESALGEMEIYKLIEVRGIHFFEDDEGRVIVCLNSLRRLM